MNRRFRWTAYLAALMLVTAACAAEPDAGTEPPAETTPATDPAGTTPPGEATPDETTPDETTPPDGTTPPAGDGAYPHLEAAMAGEHEGAEVQIVAQWLEAEGDNFEAALQPFRDATGINVVYEGLDEYNTVLPTRVDGGNPPDLAQIAQPGLLQQFAAAGNLVNLGEWMNVEQLETDYAPFIDMTRYEDNVYGVFYKTDIKSIVWYSIPGFEAGGYEIPETWDELIALSDQIVADGSNPWCVSMEDGGNSGWVATDWLEDIMLRTAGGEAYDQWVNHELAFDSPEVVEAADHMAEIWFSPDYVYGGSTAINSTWIGESQTPMFAEGGPDCFMHKQAAWIPDFWPEGTEAGTDSAFFYFPPIDEAHGSPVMGAGDQFVMFNDRPEVRALLEFLATPEGAQGWIENGGFLSPNSATPVEWYAYPQDELAAILAEADSFRFDASDLMPAEVGAGSFWTGMVEWVAADGENTEAVFTSIGEAWPS